MEQTERIKRLLKAFFASRNITLASDDALRLWVAGLADLDPDQLQEAIIRFTRESTEYPTVAALRRFAGIHGIDDKDRASKAWASVRDAIRRVGAYASPDFADLICNAVIREMGGWVAICETETDQMVWREKEFVAKYQATARSGLGDASPLVGIEATHNARLGYSGPDPTEITAGLPQHPLARRLDRHDAKRLPAPEVQAVAARLAERSEPIVSPIERPESEPPKSERTEEELIAEADEKRKQANEWLEQQKTGTANFSEHMRRVSEQLEPRP